MVGVGQGQATAPTIPEHGRGRAPPFRYRFFGGVNQQPAPLPVPCVSARVCARADGVQKVVAVSWVR
jgi:hypothetical protein